NLNHTPNSSPTWWVEQAGFEDPNIVAQYTDTPPTWADPFPSGTGYPSVVSYYQQRLLFGAMRLKPETITGAGTADCHTVGAGGPPADDDSFLFTLGATDVQEIRDLLPLNQLVALTSGAVWLILGDEAGILVPAAINPKNQGYWGSSRVPALR